MGALDGVLLAVLLMSCLLGLWRGVIRETMALAAWLLGFLLSSKYAADTAVQLPPDWGDNLRYLAGWLLVFVAVWLVVAGVFRIIFAIRVRKAIEGEFLIALSGMLAIALGLLFLYSPASALVAAKFWIGVGSLLYGGLQVGAGLMLRRHRTLAA
jgi:uncharacterized membrane protein HdeD (DUF308 family)